MNKLAIIDGNNLFREVFENVVAKKGLEGARNVHFNKLFVNKMKHSIKDCQFVYITFDSKEKCFRYDLYTKYKANRKVDNEKKILWRQVLTKWQNYLKNKKIPFCIIDGLEADDVIATIAKKYSNSYEVVIVSADGDMHQLIDENVSVYNFRYKSQISLNEIKYNPGVFKVLQGDKSDNIPGILSEKKSMEIAEKFEVNKTPTLEDLKLLVADNYLNALVRNYNLIILKEYQNIPFRKVKSEDLKFL